MKHGAGNKARAIDALSRPPKFAHAQKLIDIKNAVAINDGVLVCEIKSGFAGRRCRNITEPKSLSHFLVGKS
jgi:hypothetical protein